ncbi:hypothetical protein D3C84_186220 [compost metagenome]
MFEQAARGRHYDVSARFQLLGLHVLLATAHQRQHGDLEVLGEVIDVVGDLLGQLAGRSHDQHPGVGRLQLGRLVQQALQDRQREGGGLAGPGLGAGQHVATTTDGRDRLLLHRGHLLITAI